MGRQPATAELLGLPARFPTPSRDGQAKPWQVRIDKPVAERVAGLKSAAAVYLALGVYADVAGECWPSVQSLVKLTGLSERSVRYHLGVLEREAVLRRERRGGDSTLYHLGGAAGCSTPDEGLQQVAAGGCKKRPRGAATGCTQKELQEGTPVKKRAARALVPTELLDLIDSWNALGEGIISQGNHARRDPPSKALLAAWNRAQRDPELRVAMADRPALIAAIKHAEFCHGQRWFDLLWLFGKNRDGALKVERLLAGAYDDGDGDQRRQKPRDPDAPCPGARHYGLDLGRPQRGKPDGRVYE